MKKAILLKLRLNVRYPVQGHLLRISICFILVVSCISVPAQEQVGRGVIVRELGPKKPVKALEIDRDGFIWVGTSSGLYRFDGFEFELMQGDSMALYPSAGAGINALLEDRAGHLWISTQHNLFILTPDRTERLYVKALVPDPTALQRIVNIQEIGNEVWLFNETKKILCLTQDAKGALQYSRTIELPSSVAAAALELADGQYMIEPTIRNHYYILSPDGTVMEKTTPALETFNFYLHPVSKRIFTLSSPVLYVFDPDQKIFREEISFLPSFLKPIPSWMTASRRSPGSLWVGGRLGHLLWYSPVTGTYLELTELLNARLFEGRFFSATVGVEDEYGGFWLGTTLGLVYIKLPELQYFNHLRKPQTLLSRQSFSTRGMVRGRDGSLFVGSYAGFFRYVDEHPEKEYKIWNDIIGKNVDPVVYDLLPDGDEILIASEGNGLLRYRYDTDSIYRVNPSSYYHHPGDPEITAQQWVFRLFRDHSGTRWAGVNAGLFLITPDGKAERPPGLSDSGRKIGRVYDIMEDTTSVLWLATATGLYSISPERNQVRFHALPLVADTDIQCLLNGDNGSIWIGTRGHGLLHYHPATGAVSSYMTDDGLADNIVCAIQPGGNRTLWVSTNQGLTLFDFTLKTFNSFYIEDGLPDNEFNHGSSMRDDDGRLYFGGVNGVVTFYPDKDNFNRNFSKLRITKIVTHDGRHGTTVRKLYNSHLRPELRLHYKDKYFTVYFASNDPTPYKRERYVYRLSGLDNTWQLAGMNNSIQFTGLQPGRYFLQIKATDRHDHDAMLEVPVFIARPIFRQWWAYILYVLAFAGIGILIIREYFKRLHIHRQLQLELDHKAKLQEINRSKSTFFTNITHEFKTPLTLIQGPADEISRSSKDPQVVRQAGLISKSAKSILALVNQLLELGKLEANLEEPQFHRLDVVYHVQMWMEKFVSLARQKEIRLGFETEQTAFYIDFDPVKFETVINNLLSNAIKFAPEKGVVKCRISTSPPNMIEITVEDNGPGIPMAEQALIFERFYQGKNSRLGGTGIGLAFVREMVRLHGGTVSVASAPGQGTAFTIQMPTYQSDSMVAVRTTVDVPEKIGAITSFSNASVDHQVKDASEKAVILIAEDHMDVAQFIMDILQKEYTVWHAQNGRDAHRLAIDHIPDLIITDVMMPVMDGYSFTHLIKQEIHTSHIPVIMLTAKDGEASRIEGRSAGAEVYLQKPFSMQELQLTIRNLLQLKANMAEKASKQLEKNADEVEFSTHADASFYQNFLAVLDQNLSESSLAVEDFTTALATSRTQLHRKLKAITGLSVNQIVRNVRLQKGLALIRAGNRTIGEVAYQVGFSNPAYFTERFKEYYGYPPSEANQNPMPGPSS